MTGFRRGRIFAQRNRCVTLDHIEPRREVALPNSSSCSDPSRPHPSQNPSSGCVPSEPPERTALGATLAAAVCTTDEQHLRPDPRLVARQEVVVSEHGYGYDELAADDILIEDAFSGVRGGSVVEDYPDYPKGPCVLVLQQYRNGKPIHVLWGIPTEVNSPAVIITAYRPDPDRWTEDFSRRIS